LGATLQQPYLKNIMARKSKRAMNNHISFMKQCIALGKKAISQGDSPVGAIVVKDNTVIGTGIEAGKSSQNITKHAEIEAVNNALFKNELKDLNECILYTTHEPCIMCSYVIRYYKLQTIVYGTNVEHVGGITSDLKVMLTTKVPKWGKAPNIIGNILRDECEKLATEYKTKNKNHENSD
jgi:tRNA(adenine34) deaminase